MECEVLFNIYQSVIQNFKKVMSGLAIGRATKALIGLVLWILFMVAIIFNNAIGVSVRNVGIAFHPAL